MQFWCKSGSYCAKREARKGNFDSASICLHTGGNMMTSFQLLLRNEEAGFTVTGVELGGDTTGLDIERFYQDFLFFADKVPYPDLLSRGDTIEVRPNYTQGIFFTVFNESAKPGTRLLTVTVHTTLGDYTARVTLCIHKATLGEAKDAVLQHEYWTYFFANTADFTLTAMKDKITTPFYDFANYSPEWWGLLEHYCRFLRRMRINTVRLEMGRFLQHAGSKRTGEMTWHFDFSRLDETTEYVLKNASVKRLTVPHFVEPLHRRTVSVLEEDGTFKSHDLFDDPVAEAFLRAVYTAIYDHFKEKGWLSYLCMHLQDEPHQPETWLYARKICRECMPGVPVSEPMDFPAIGPAIDKECDILIPRFDIYEKDRTYYEKLPENGTALWCYSCCFPQEPWWLNKFLDLPHHYSAMIYWACFSQDITGYLHWGFNLWETDDRLFSGDEVQFKGDSFIVYPDVKNNNLLPTVRAVATAEGTQDYELLSMLKQHDPDTAKQLSRRVAFAFDRFAEDPAVLENTRAEVLTLLDAVL